MTCMHWSPLHGAGGLGRLPGELLAMQRGSLQACWRPQQVTTTWQTLWGRLLARSAPVMLACRLPQHLMDRGRLML